MGLLDRFKAGRDASADGPGVREKIGDGFRGRPDVDLRDYADSRGLSHGGQSSQVGYMAAMPLSEELQFNVLRGELPGGAEGMIFHNVELLDADSAGGSFYGKRSNQAPVRGLGDAIERLTIGGASQGSMFKVPSTTVAIRVPEAQGALVGFQLGRRNEGTLQAGELKVGRVLGRRRNEPLSSGPQHWAGRKLDDLGADGWYLAYRGRAQEEAIERILEGPLQELLATERPPRFRVTFAFGVLWLRRQQFAKRDAELDELAQTASRLAGEIRRIAEADSKRLSFEERVAEPSWAEIFRAKPKDTFVGADGQDLGSAGAVAADRGLTLEDPFAFARGFSDLGFPGEPYAVMRGPLRSGDARGGRIAMTLGRPVKESSIDPFLEHKVGGPWGCNVALIPLAPGCADSPGEQQPWSAGGAYTVRRGVLSAWKPRFVNRVTPAELEDLTNGALDLADELSGGGPGR